MQADSIISNTISQDIRLKGHQSIRFAPDGFSVLISDASYQPVFLKQYLFKPEIPPNLHPAECGRVLDESGLLSFEGETVLIVDTLAVTVVPNQFLDDKGDRAILQTACRLSDTDQVDHRLLRDRKLQLVYSIPEEIVTLKERFSCEVKVIHPSECLVSLSDQVKASDHQRGVVIAEIQPYTLDLLVIQEDQIRLLNRYALKDTSDFIYHTLNTIKQLKLERETIPIYLSGIIHQEHELYGLLGKYVRHVKTTPYYLEELSKVHMLQYMILSEGSKCA